jgi:cell division protein FtsN
MIKDKAQAEAVRKDLAAKGYKAVIRTAPGGGGYIVTTSPVTASKAYTLLEQMKIQGVGNTKVIKVDPSPVPAKSPVPQGKAIPADKGHRRS